jgi:hypothetical protein
MSDKIQKIGKIKSLISQFPFLESLTKGFNQEDVICDIKIKRVDTNLLIFKSVDHNGINSSVMHKDGELEGTQIQYSLLVDSSGILLTENSSHIRVFEKLQKIKDLNTIKYIVEYTEHEFRKYGDINSERLLTQINIRINKVPHSGLTNIVDTFDVRKNVMLNHNDVMFSKFKSETLYNEVSNDLNKLVEKFNLNVYGNGLLKVIDDCPQRGMSAKFKNINIRSMATIGRVIITLENENSQVTFVGDENIENPNIGIHSFHGTLPNIDTLIESFIKHWNEIDVPFENVYKSGKVLFV